MNTVLKRAAFILGTVSLSVGLAACGHDDHDHDHENEVITTVTLTFTPEAGGAPVVAKWNDADGEGGAAPTIDPITLAAGKYDLSVKFENVLEMPAEDITLEVLDEADQHFVFLTGTAVSGPASNQAIAPLTHTYNDTDKNGLPVGIKNKIDAKAGMGVLTLTLRHMPPVGGAAVKTATGPETVKTSGFATLGGSNDVQVNFNTTVN